MSPKWCNCGADGEHLAGWWCEAPIVSDPVEKGTADLVSAADLSVAVDPDAVVSLAVSDGVVSDIVIRHPNRSRGCDQCGHDPAAHQQCIHRTAQHKRLLRVQAKRRPVQ